MEKSKLGITVGLLAMIMFLMGTVSTVAAVLIAAYILLRETNEWLKHSAVKYLAITVIFGALSCALSTVDSSVNVIACIDRWDGFSKVCVPYSIDTILFGCFGIIENVLLLVLAVKALKMKTLRIKPIDNLLAKHGSEYIEKPVQAEMVQCPQCGQLVPKNALYCTKCGNRLQ